MFVCCFCSAHAALSVSCMCVVEGFSTLESSALIVTLTSLQKSSISSDALKNLKAEKNANIERRKTIDADLQRLNKDISEMVRWQMAKL